MRITGKSAIIMECYPLAALMLTTGNELRALAAVASLNVSTFRSMEASGAGPIAGRAANVQAVQRCLEAAGIEFIPAAGVGGGAGVRLREGKASADRPD